MSCRRKVAGLLLMAGCFALLSAEPAQAQVVVYGGYGTYYGGYGAYYGGYGVYAAPVAPVYPVTVAPAYPVPVYGGYAAPVPVSYGGYYTAYPPVAPIGHVPIYPRNGLEVEYKFRNGLWYVDVDY